MGIQGLMKLIGDYAPSAVKDNDIKNYFGKEYCEWCKFMGSWDACYNLIQWHAAIVQLDPQ